ncbi:E3 ubiquitin-protein ligase Mdm2 isoform X2 [Brachyhypopomus gauderio]|uniref:E3 ubiquitin-protein ligase Mdm2 isoform X2 n=1 Tax=Brachyhypopomus gauderio TaxID=698409 RepID=UPI004041FCA5
MATDNCLSSSQINKIDNEKLVRPKVQLQTLLRDAGADKDVFTMKEVMFYLGKYIMSKELYDKQQQHIVHCGSDALGAVLGVASFSVKEPRALFAMISKNLIAVKDPDSQTSLTELSSQREPDPKEPNSDSSTSADGAQQRRRRRSSDSANFSVDEESGEPRKRHKSDSFSLTFDDSLSWCVIGGLRRERGSSASSVTQSNSDVGISHSEESEDSDSDNFSVEFEVESIDSDAYSENDEDSVPGEDEVYEVTIFAEDEDSFDEDPEITEADYWKCSKCEELNPPLPRHCKSCWTVQSGWLPDVHSSLEIPSSDNQTGAAYSTSLLPQLGTDPATASDPKVPPSKALAPVLEPDEGLDVPDDLERILTKWRLMAGHSVLLPSSSSLSSLSFNGLATESSSSKSRPTCSSLQLFSAISIPSSAIGCRRLVF